MAASSEGEEVYDRQIRLFGADAQTKISRSRVLLTGRGSCLLAEVCKDAVLAGFNVRLAQAADDVVGPGDARLNLFLREEDVGSPTARAMLPRVRAMNPLADVDVVEGAVDGAAVLAQFATVVGVSLPFAEAERLDEACRAAGVPFVACDSSEELGWIALSLGEAWRFAREVRVDLAEGEAPRTEIVEAAYPTLARALGASWASLPTGKRRAPDAYLGICAARRVALAREGSPPVKRPRPAPLRDEPPPEALARLAVDALAADMPLEARRTYDLSRAAAVAVPFLATRRTQSSAVCTVVGGLVGNELIKIVSRKDEPSNNLVLFDARTMSAVIKRGA